MKSALILAIFLVFSMSLATRECPNERGYEWIQRGNKCYLFNTEKGDLYENIAFCNQLNASLVSITSDDENMEVTQLRPPDNQFWLGLGQRSNDSKEFYWFDGSPFVYESWVEEPNLTNKLGAYFQDGDWFIGSAVKLNIQACSLDLTLNASPKKTPIPAELTGSCNKTGWKRVGLKCIFFDTNKRITYKENQALCKTMNATMVSIHSHDEDIQLTSLFGTKTFWIGLKQISRKYKLYEWEDGSLKTYENWWLHEPDNLGKKYWAAFSEPMFRFPYIETGGWKDTRSYDEKYPGCQTSLLTHAEQVSTEMTN